MDDDQPSSLLQRSPIFLLPSELLCEIFSLFANRGPLQLCHAITVCKHWYHVIVSYRKLWSTITLDRDFVDRFKLHSGSALTKKADAYIRACLNRSAPFPLDVTLDNLFENIDGWDLSRGPCRSILDRLFKFGEPRHIQRCRSLSWSIGSTLYGNGRTVIGLLPRSLERLEYLFLKNLNFENDPLPHFPQCPRSKEVHLVNHLEGTSPYYFLDRDYDNVEKLTYTSDTGWIDYDIPYIQRFHKIHTLVLEDASPLSTLAYSLLEEVENTSIARLHSLETLKLIGLIPLYIMQRLHTPILKNLNITNGKTALHSLHLIPVALLQSVVSISVRYKSPSTTHVIRHLQRVVCNAPSLAYLTGTLEMGELLAEKEWFRERNIVYKCI